jgi:catechol 2,3-dioxygenase-like lactoylglutathione lyase family enzyme
MSDRAIEIEGIDHVVLRVKDGERALRFYIEVLGLRVERVIEDFHYYQLRCGRNLLDLSVLPEGESLDDRIKRDLDHVCLNVRGSLTDLLAHLEKHKVEVVNGPLELYGAKGFGTSIYVRDPDDHMLELKLNYPEYPVKTTYKEFMAGQTRPMSKPD